MNHFTMELIARDHLAELHREADRPRPVLAEGRTPRPGRVPRRVLHALVARLVVILPMAHHG
jgi:hypothetical protein